MGTEYGSSSETEEHYSSAEDDAAASSQSKVPSDLLHVAQVVSGRQCSLLETALDHCPCRRQEPDAQPEEQPTDLPSALAALEAERNRGRELMRLNVVLREHLEITTRTNEELTTDVHELTEEWRHAEHSSDNQQMQEGGGLESRLFVVSQWQEDLGQLRRDLGQLREAVFADLSSLGGALKAAQEAATQQQDNQGDSMDRWNLSQQITGDLNHQVEALNAENDRLQRALDLAAHVTQEQRHALDLSGRQVSELQAKLTQANEQQLRSQEQESNVRAKLEEQRASLQRELEAVRAALYHMQELHDQLETDRDAHQAQAVQLERQARESTVRLESLLRESESHQAELRQELSQRNTQLLDVRGALAQATSRVEALSQEAEELRQQLSQVRQEREAHAREQAQLLAQRTAAHEEFQRQAHTERQALEEELRHTQQQAEAQAQACRRTLADMDTLQGQLSQERAARQEALAQHDQQLALVQSEHRRELRRLRADHEATCSRILQEQGELRKQVLEQLRQREEACAELQERLHAEADTVHQRTKQLEALGRQAQAAREEERKLLGQGLCACRSQLLSLRGQLSTLQAQVAQGLLLQADGLREAAQRLAEQEHNWQDRHRRTAEHATRLQQQLEQASMQSAKLRAEVRQLSEVRRARDEEREQLQSLVEELRRDVTQAVSDKEAALRDVADRFREAEALRAELAAECGRLRAEHQEQERSQRAEAEAKLQREGSFWKAKVSLCESELRSCRAEVSQLQGQLQEARVQLSQEQAAHRAQVGREALQRNQDQAQWQRRLLHEGQGLHQARLALGAAQGKAAALEAHLDALAESRQRAEAALSSLLSALRCALGVAPSAKEEEAEQLVLISAVQGLVSRVGSLAGTKEQLEAETERSRRQQQELQAQLETSASEMSRLEAARGRLSAENEELRAQALEQLEEASRLRLELQTVRWEHSSLQEQLQETQRRLELLLHPKPQTSEDPLLDAQVSEKEAELQLAEARLGRLQRCLALGQYRQAAAREEDGEQAKTAAMQKVQQLQQQLASERQRSEKLGQRERLLESQLRDAQAQVATLHEERQRVCAELEMLRRDKSSLETKFSTLAVQLAESEAAKQRLHQQSTPTSSTGEGQRLHEENRWLEQELARLRSQLSRSVDAIFAAPQPRTSTPKKRQVPEGNSLRHSQEHTTRLHQLEARLRTTLQLDVSRSSHPEGDHSTQGRGDGLSAELERSLHAVAERPDRLRSEARRLERALDNETTAKPPTTAPSP